MGGWHISYYAGKLVLPQGQHERFLLRLTDVNTVEDTDYSRFGHLWTM
jgi:hypothetical protein